MVSDARSVISRSGSHHDRAPVPRGGDAGQGGRPVPALGNGSAAAELAAELLERGFLVGAFGERRIRIVTHLGVDQDDTDRLCQTLATLLTSR